MFLTPPQNFYVQLYEGLQETLKLPIQGSVGLPLTHRKNKKKTILKTFKNNFYEVHHIENTNTYIQSKTLKIKHFIVMRNPVPEIPEIVETLFFLVIRRYGQLRGPTSSSCGGLWPLAEGFFALRAKKWLFMLSWGNLRPFFVFSRNYSSFQQ